MLLNSIKFPDNTFCMQSFGFADLAILCTFFTYLSLGQFSAIYLPTLLYFLCVSILSFISFLWFLIIFSGMSLYVNYVNHQAIFYDLQNACCYEKNSSCFVFNQSLCKNFVCLELSVE